MEDTNNSSSDEQTKVSIGTKAATGGGTAAGNGGSAGKDTENKTEDSQSNTTV